jgi:hypothetical protein
MARTQHQTMKNRLVRLAGQQVTVRADGALVKICAGR